MPITIEAASAPLTKNTATSTITTTEVTAAIGNCSSSVNSATSGWATASIRFACPLSCRLIAVPPRIANHTNVTPLGISSTPMTNSRIVRPFEMRARNVPTNGAHEIHHTQ